MIKAKKRASKTFQLTTTFTACFLGCVIYIDSMNKYISYIENMKKDPNVDDKLYIELIKGFKCKLETWLMESPRFSNLILLRIWSFENDFRSPILN